MRFFTLTLGLVATVSFGGTAQSWKLLQFTGSESFAYTITHTDGGVEQAGRLALSLNSSGTQAMASIEASLGDASCSANLPMTTPQAVAPMMMMQCAVIAPVAMAMFAPMWGMFLGQQWVLGTRMSMNQGEDEMSFEISETCSFAGQSGLLAQIRTNDLEVDTCVDPNIPLPLMVQFNNKADEQFIKAVLTTYTP